MPRHTTYIIRFEFWLQLLVIFMALGAVVDFSKPQFSVLENEVNNIIYFIKNQG